MSIEAMKQALSVCVEATWALAHACEKNPVYASAYDKLSDLTPKLRQAIEQAQKQEPVAWADDCRIELVTAIHMLSSDFENALYAFRGDTEARKSAEGSIAHALGVAVKWNRNGRTSPPPRQPLTDEELWKFWWARPEVPDGEDDSMEAEFVAAVRRVLAAHGIKGEA